MRTVHIEKKPRDTVVAAKSVRAAILERARRGDRGSPELTPADAATLSGVPLDEAEPALLRLAQLYPSRIRVTDAGDLLFRFDSLRDPRDEAPPPWLRTWRRVRGWFARHHAVFFAVITLMMAPPLLLLAAANVGGVVVEFYDQGFFGWCLAFPAFLLAFSLFCVGFFTALFLQVFPLLGLFCMGMAISMLVMPLIDEDGGGDAPYWVFAIFAALIAGVAWWLLRMAYVTFKEVAAGKKAEWAPKMWLAFGGFLFGKVRLPRSPTLDDERDLAALIRDQRGVITTYDLVRLFGWTVEEADQQLTRILVDYGGDVMVSDEGVILYVFEPLMRTTGELARDANSGAEDGATTPARRHLGEPPALFGCSRAFATWMVIISAFGTLGLLTYALAEPFPTAEHYRVLGGMTKKTALPLLIQGLGAWPYVFLLGLPLLRVPLWLVQRLRWRARGRALFQLEAMAQTAPEAREAQAVAERVRSARGEGDVIAEPVVFDTAAR